MADLDAATLRAAAEAAERAEPDWVTVARVNALVNPPIKLVMTPEAARHVATWTPARCLALLDLIKKAGLCLGCGCVFTAPPQLDPKPDLCGSCRAETR